MLGSHPISSPRFNKQSMSARVYAPRRYVLRLRGAETERARSVGRAGLSFFLLAGRWIAKDLSCSYLLFVAGGKERVVSDEALDR